MGIQAYANSVGSKKLLEKVRQEKAIFHLSDAILCEEYPFSRPTAAMCCLSFPEFVSHKTKRNHQSDLV